VCIGSAQALSLTAVILLVFAHVGQISTSALPRALGMVSMNVTSFASCLSNATGDPFPGMYQSNASIPLGMHLGLRDIYSWGFFKYCAYVVSNTTDGMCTNTTFGYPFDPLDTMLSDVITNSTTISQFSIPQTTSFTNSSYLSNTSHTGFYLIFVGMLCAFVATLSGLRHSKPTFFIASVFDSTGTLLVLIGAALWTSLVHSAMQINDTLDASGSCIGISLSYGMSQWLIWAAVVVLLVSLPLYIISFATWHPPRRPHLNRHPSGGRYKPNRR